MRTRSNPILFMNVYVREHDNWNAISSAYSWHEYPDAIGSLSITLLLCRSRSLRVTHPTQVTSYFSSMSFFSIFLDFFIPLPETTSPTASITWHSSSLLGQMATIQCEVVCEESVSWDSLWRRCCPISSFESVWILRPISILQNTRKNGVISTAGNQQPTTAMITHMPAK